MSRRFSRFVTVASLIALLSAAPALAQQVSILPVNVQHSLGAAAAQGPQQLVQGVKLAVASNPGMAQSIVNYAATLRPGMGQQLADAANQSLGFAEKAYANELAAARAASAGVHIGTTGYILGGMAVIGGGIGAFLAMDSGSESQVSYDEYGAQWGLAMIGAQSAYDRGATGAGVLVGVVDSGIDDTYYEFTGRIASGGQNFIGGRTSSNITDSPLDGHGTHVSGIIAANQDNLGMHGVAYEATVLPLRIFETDSNGVDYTATPTEVAAAITYGVSQGVDVFNGSYGYTTSAPITMLEVELDAYAAAMDAGAIMVFATGNDSEANPHMPAAMPFIAPANDGAGIYTGNTNARDYTAYDDRLIAVTSVDSDGNLSSFANACGVAAAWCIAAPGGSIYSTVPDNSYATFSGTSMAAPHVSGAVALLIDMYPSLTSAQIVDRIFTTANSSGIYANSALYGHGLLNLTSATSFIATAMMPVGATLSDTSYRLDQSRIALAAPFGDGLSAALSAVPMKVVDSYDGAGIHSTGAELVEVAAESNTIDDGLRRFGRRSNVRELTGFVSGTLQLTEVAGNSQHEAQREARFTTQLSKDTAVSVGYMDDPALGLGLVADGSFDPQESRAQGAFMSPYLSLAADGTNMVAETKFDNITVRSASFFGKADEEMSDSQSFGAATELQFSPFGESRVNMQVGFLRETDSFLGSQGEGATAMGESSTLFGGLSFALPVAEGMELLGSYFLGTSSAQGANGSLVGNFSGITSDAMSLGLIQHDVASKGDRLGFVVNQPLRVNGGSASLHLPGSLSRVDNTVYVGYSDVTTGLAPTGREVDLEAFYSTQLGENTDLSTSLMYRHQPGHVADAAGEMQALVRLNHKLGN